MNIGSESLTKQYRYCPQCGKSLGEGEEGGVLRQMCLGETCGFIFYDNPTPVVAAIVEHEGDIILARNVAWPESWYALITGFLEKNESPEEGILREVKEELNLDGHIQSLVGLHAFTKRNQLLITYHVLATGEIELNQELADIKRVKPADLKPWPFGTGLAVRDWLIKNGYKSNI